MKDDKPEEKATPAALADAMRRSGGLFGLAKDWLLKLRQRNHPNDTLH